MQPAIGVISRPSWRRRPVADPLAPLASFRLQERAWPEEMVEIKWDRDTCVVCNMVISDRRFAGEMRGGPNKTVSSSTIQAAWPSGSRKSRKIPWLADAGTDVGCRLQQQEP